VRNWHSRLPSIALALLVMLRIEAANAQKYNFTTIDVPNALSTNARGISSDGTVVGFYRDQSFTPHGFLRPPDGSFKFPIDYVNPLVTVIGTELNRIDPQGQTTVGWWFDSAFLIHGLVMNLSSSTTISFDFPLPGVLATITNGINRNGYISGNYVDSGGTSHGFTANVTCLSQISCYQSFDYPGGLQTEFGGVNDSDDIVGDYLAADSKTISFLFSAGNFSILSPPSAPNVSARNINNLQQIVGSYGNALPFLQVSQMASGLFIAPGSLHGFVLNASGQVTTVNFTGPDAQQTGIGAINDSGVIVGHYISPGFVSHGYLAVPPN
jgi:uncharacterized membrane protein